MDIENLCSIGHVQPEWQVRYILADHVAEILYVAEEALWLVEKDNSAYRHQDTHKALIEIRKRADALLKKLTD